MTKERLLKEIDEQMRKRVQYGPNMDCQWWVRHLYRLDGFEFPESVYLASKEFVIVKGVPRIMDIVVFRNSGGKSLKGLMTTRHVGVMIDEREFTHFSLVTGIAKHEIDRLIWSRALSHVARHRKYAAEIG